MAVKKLDDLVAFQLAVDFKLRVYALVRKHPRVKQDDRYCSQLFDAASGVESNIAEGWRRFVAREMCQFLRYGLASLEEAKRRVRDGIHRGYFTDEECRELLTIGDRCGAATMGLWKSLQPFTESSRSRRPRNKSASRPAPGGPQGPRSTRRREKA